MNGFIWFFGLIAISIGGGWWAIVQKRKLRLKQFMGRKPRSMDAIVKDLQSDEISDFEWIAKYCREISQATSIPIELLLPTDRIGFELAPVAGFEGFDPLDWIPGEIRSNLDADTTLRDLAVSLWRYGFGRRVN